MKNRKQSNRNKNIAISVVCALLILALIYGIAYSTGFVQKSLTAVKIGDYKVNALEYRYYYTDAKTALINEYGTEMAANGVNFNMPLEDQFYAEGISWAEYIHNQAIAELTEIYGMYGAAEEAGHVMSEEMKASVESYIDALTGSATSQNISADKYLNQTYGKNIGLDEIREFVTRRYYAVDYINKVQAEFKPTVEDLKAYYEANPNKLDVVSYNYYHVNYEVAEGNDVITNQNKEAAKLIADDIYARATDAESFAEAVYEHASEEMKAYYEDHSVTHVEAGIIREDAGVIAEWYADPARKPGDKAIIEGTNKFTVILFHKRYLEEYNSIDVRHLLIKPEAAEDETDVDQVLAVHQAAVDKIEAIYETFLAGDMSEESFTALVMEHSEDNADEGGLYTEVCKNQMVDEFEDWCFEEGRKPGDHGLIKSEYGYHMMYFVGENRPAWQVNAESKMSTEQFDAFFAEKTEGQEIKTNLFAMNMAY
ncbi:MAG: peptidylprolyl isomerase [Clostridia bacterium]|nr:peptidylprolyl isomerase [Clostridia bacterium]